MIPVKIKEKLPSLERTSGYIAWIGAAVCLCLIVLRAYSVFVVSSPFWGITSGDEQSSLFAIWRFINGLPVYFDRFQPPFSLASYNWLFYEMYGVVSGMAMHLFGLSDEWIPHITRIITLVGAIFISIITFKFTADRWPPESGSPKLSCGPLAILVGLGPLIGFWAVTTRADVWAMSMEAAAVFIFFRYHRRAPWATIISLILILYIAWSFKQTAILITTTTGLFLIARGRWAEAVIFGAGLIILWAGTFMIKGDAYAVNILFIGVPLEYTVSRMLTNVINFAAKAPPLYLPIGAMILLYPPRKWIPLLRENDVALFCTIGLSLGLVEIILLTRQLGSAENYYFSLSLVMALGLSELFAQFSRNRGRLAKALHTTYIAGWTGLAIAVTLVFTGTYGRIGLEPEQQDIVRAKACLDRLPRPVFTASNLLSLPWLIPGNGEYFVLSDLYNEDFAAGTEFNGGGIAGRIKNGYFASIFMQKSNDHNNLYGSRLDNYVQIRDDACNPFTALVKKSP